MAARITGGKNWWTAAVRLRYEHEHIQNRRKDFLNILAHSLLRQYDQIAVEDVRITKLVKNQHLSKTILDAG